MILGAKRLRAPNLVGRDEKRKRFRKAGGLDFDIARPSIRFKGSDVVAGAVSPLLGGPFDLARELWTTSLVVKPLAFELQDEFLAKPTQTTVLSVTSNEVDRDHARIWSPHSLNGVDWLGSGFWARRSESDPFAARKVIHLGA